MKKPVRITLAVLGTVVLLAVVALVAIKLTFTKERVLGWVVPPLEQRLHRQVNIGDVSAGFFGIQLDGLDVRSEGADAPLVAARTVRVEWNPWALLGGAVEIEAVRLVAPRVRVVRLQDGNLDIADLMAGGTEGPGGAAAEPERRPPAEGPTPALPVTVSLFALENGSVAFEDRTLTPPKVLSLEGIDLRVRDITLDGPMEFELDVGLPPADAARFQASGTLDPSRGDVTANLRVPVYPLDRVKELASEAGRLTGGTLDLEASLSVQGGARVNLTGRLDVKSVTWSDAPAAAKPLEASVQWSAVADLEAGTAGLEPLNLTLADQQLTLTSQVVDLTVRPKVTFVAESPGLDLDRWLALLPEPVAGEKAEPAPEPVPPAKDAGPPEVPALDLTGDIRLAFVRAQGLLIENIDAHVALDQGKLRVDPLGLLLYGGRLKSTLGADLAAAGTPFRADLALEGTDLGALLKDLGGSLGGAATGTAMVAFQGSGRADALLETLDSVIKVEIKDGKVLTHPLAQNFAKLFQVREYEKLNFYNVRADLTTAEGTANISPFVFRGPNLQATGMGSAGLLSRKLDLRVAVAMPREIAAKVVPQAAVLDAVSDSQGWARLPMRLSGTLDEPGYGLDNEALAAAAARAVGGKAAEVMEKKVLEKLPVGEGEKNTIRKGLNQLLGQ